MVDDPTRGQADSRAATWNPTLKEIADEVRSWPAWLRFSSSVANAARAKGAAK